MEYAKIKMFDRRKRETTCTVLHLKQHTLKIKKKIPSHSLQILILLPHVFLKLNMILISILFSDPTAKCALPGFKMHWL